MHFPRRRLVRGAVSLPLAVAVAACGGGGTSTTSAPVRGTPFPDGSFMARIVQRGRLVAGVKQDQPLFGYLNPRTNEFEGFDVDMVKEVAKALFGGDASPARLELKPVTSAQRIPLLQEGGVDIIAATMTINEERKQQIDFSDVYYVAGQGLLVTQDSTVKSIKDLDQPDKIICSVKGSTSEQNIRKFAPNAVEPALYDGYAECLVPLKQGQVHALSTDDVILMGYASQDPSLKLVGDRFTEEPYGLGMAKASTGFQEFVNGVLRTMKTDGRWKAIYQKWLGRFGPVPEPPK
ncbi:MAG TPA: glutamate ABC transporter substrate-binding protein [Chloroflexota bacterium]|nr:glutamate ABC transporter substrate-binding protein [Chloroflexota bacterium]